MPPLFPTPRTKNARGGRLVATVLVVGLGAFGCSEPMPSARAYRVTSRAQLIGGPNALGEVGDFLLENDKIRVIIQDEGFSRGFGVFGGSLIDADLVRPGTGPGSSNEGGGRDNFGELFPSFFLEALAPSEVFDPDDPTGQRKLAAIEVTSDGRDGTAAEVTVRGYGGDFLSLTQTINEFLLDDPREAPNLLFTTTYRLAPGHSYVEIVTTVHNVAFPGRDLTLPNDLLGITVPSPFGDVLLFGAGNKVFLPHEAGFDTRFRLEAVYQAQNITLPALPGLTAEFIASAGPDVSYGLLAAPPSDPELNFAYHNREFFPDATSHSLHVPFLASAFTGVFQVLPPPVLAANDGALGGADEYSFTRYFIVGSGDVASVSDVVHGLLGTETGSFEGQVRDTDGGHGVDGVSLIVTDPTGKKVTQLYTDTGGRFRARLPAGQYNVVLLKEGREIPTPAPFAIKSGERTFLPLDLQGAARLVVTVVESGVGPVPAKVSLVGTAPVDTIGTDPRAWLFDLSLGERYRYTDFEPDTDEPSTRRYLEDFGYTEEGVATLKARPGTYTVVVTRGPEYERVEIPEVELTPGKTRSLTASLRRVVDTEGYIAADFHLHSIYSLDSFANLEERVTSYAGEGLELVVATDHNYVVDYGPTIGKLGLERFVHSLVGLELTTIDRGHFNGFPLRRGSGALERDGEGRYENTIASRTFGSFQWAERTPQQIFDSLRALAPKKPSCLAANKRDPSACPDEVERVIVQVNHPRDSILGYFDQYALDQESLEVKGQSGLIGANTEQHPEYAASEFSWDFDAIEVFNGKRFELLHNFRVPEGLPQDPVLGRPLDPSSCCPLSPGDVVREYPAFDCDETVRDCTCTSADAEAQVAAGRCETGEILHPGVVEDWFQILRAGRRVVGTANSDSHEPDAEEPGYPRSYVRVSDDSPRNVTGQDIVAGFLSGDVLMTNGPFVQVVATSGTNSAGMGDTLGVMAAQLHVSVEIRHAPWVVPNHASVYHDGIVVADTALSSDGSGVIAAEFDLEVSRDGFVVVEVTGDENMFPSVYPQEVPSLQFTDVIGALGDSFGFLGGGGLQPALTYQVTPYALTNPIYLDADGDGVVTPQLSPPGLAELAARAPAGVTLPPAAAALGDPPLLDARPPWQRYRDSLPARKRRALEQRLPEWLWPTAHPKDIRRVFAQFARHAH